MKIVDLLQKQGINLDFNPSSKQDCINELVDLMDKTGNLNNKEEYKKAIIAREELSTTGIGDGIAIPHGKTKAVNKATLAAAVSKNGVDYDALDGQPVNLFFMIAVPDNSDNLHLDVLARLSTILMDESFRKSLIECGDKDAFLKLIDEKEQEKFPEENKEEAKETASNDGSYRVLAVTACPTGIAHTYMAAESLEKKGKEMGISIKVETNGSGGAKNILTKEEIEKAECIIVAADKNVEMARFNGKRVIKCPVANGIHKAEELINEAVSGKAPVYHHDGAVDSGSSEIEKESFGRQIYKHLMNGVSNMLPFVIGGGILIALAFLIDSFAAPNAGDKFGMATPASAFFKIVGGYAFDFMLPVLAGFIAMSIADRPALAVGFVGGYIAKEGLAFNNLYATNRISAGFLGALLAGFAAGYFVLALKKLFSYLPDALEGLKPTLLYPFFGILGIGAFMCLVNPVMGSINTGLTGFLNSMGGTSKILLGVILGAMMSIDMGGPFNKAAYVFGTASLASGNFEVMAAVMAGGMVPPLAIALATTFFKNRFTKSERQSGLTNYIMGFSFITEGAIPFAAADPLRVIPSCAIGAAVAGGLSMFFDCTLRAPHGGIFVIGIVGNPLQYLVSIVIGAVVGMVLLAILKKPVQE